MGVAGCSTQKNTARNRWWHAFNAKYNTYYNGTLAYIDASLEKEQGNKDNYTELIPLYTVTNKNSRDLGKSNYERAIEKCEKAIHLHSIKHRPEWNKSRKKTARDIEWLNRREYNPFLWKAWLLMGRSQFFKGDFEGAAATFSYMSRLYATQPAIYGRARAWLAKCYIEQDWTYDAEDVIRNMARDSIHWRAQKEWDYTYADYYIHTADYVKAIPYLRKVISHEMRRKQKAREWYLMGQIQAAIGNNAEAYKAFKHVIRLNPPYELEFNARISMSEVMASSNAKQMIGRLKRMAKSDKNKDYLDQVFYAIGNIYLAKKDTTNAINAYEKGNSKATRSGIEKGVLLLHLGDLYWQQEKYSNARRCYGEAIGLLDKERKDYPKLADRSKVLDELVPYTDAVHLQDSLQSLAKMDEKDRNEAIDRVIEALKKKEKEERNKKAEEEVAKMQAQNGGINNNNNNNNNKPAANSNSMAGNTQWYFYNPIAVSQGKTTFQRQWGKRENVDNWQRINKTVVANAMGVEEMTDQMRDSLAQAAVTEDSLKQINDSAQNNPHKREYYLTQIPFTQEQIAASNKILEDGLFHAGVIFKDKLDNLGLSEKALLRLTKDYADYEHIDDAYYHLYLLYARKNMMDKAESYIKKLKEDFPDSQWTTLLSDPYYMENAKFGVQIEDSLYAATYNAFKASRYQEVKGNALISETRFPMGANRDKLLFIGGLSKLNDGDANGCITDMKAVVEKYPNSRISEIAGMIVNGVNAGRRLRGGKFDLEDVWNRRNVVLNDSSKEESKNFNNERNANFVFMYVYQPDSVNENQLLFEMAKFNFMTYLVRNFDINIEDQDGLHQMKITGFRNYDEARQYAQAVFEQKPIARLIGKCRTFIINEANLEMLSRGFSYNEYAKYYDKHYGPLKISHIKLLTEPTEIITSKKQEEQEIPDEQNSGNDTDDGFSIEPSAEEGTPQGLDIPDTPGINVPDNVTAEPTEQGITIPAETSKEPVTSTPANNMSKNAAPTKTDMEGNSTKPTSSNATPQKPTSPTKATGKPQPQPAKEDTGITFKDEDAAKNKGKDTGKKKEKNTFDLEDEYYDLDGF